MSVSSVDPLHTQYYDDPQPEAYGDEDNIYDTAADEEPQVYTMYCSI